MISWAEFAVLVAGIVVLFPLAFLAQKLKAEAEKRKAEEQARLAAKRKAEEQARLAAKRRAEEEARGAETLNALRTYLGEAIHLGHGEENRLVGILNEWDTADRAEILARLGNWVWNRTKRNDPPGAWEIVERATSISVRMSIRNRDISSDSPRVTSAKASGN
jgi:Tfp pilus assembly protein PilV